MSILHFWKTDLQWMQRRRFHLWTHWLLISPPAVPPPRRQRSWQRPQVLTFMKSNLQFPTQVQTSTGWARASCGSVEQRRMDFWCAGSTVQNAGSGHFVVASAKSDRVNPQIRTYRTNPWKLWYCRLCSFSRRYEKIQKMDLGHSLILNITSLHEVHRLHSIRFEQWFLWDRIILHFLIACNCLGKNNRNKKIARV